MYDLICEDCGFQRIDVLEAIASPPHPCPACGLMMRRAFLTHTASVIPDTIVGGIDIKNGLVERDGTPRHFESRSELRRATKEAGLVNRVEHVGKPGSDRSPHTTRWI